MMNKEAILKVADAIEQHSVPGLAFNMNYTYREGVGYTPSPDQDRMVVEGSCGSCACFIGWTNLTIQDDGPSLGFGDPASAARKLGFEYDDDDEGKALTSTRLFYPPVHTWSHVTPEQGVRVLRHLAETGEVDWSV